MKEIEFPAHKSMREAPGLASKQMMPRIMMIDFQWAENVCALNACKNNSKCQNLHRQNWRELNILTAMKSKIFGCRTPLIKTNGQTWRGSECDPPHPCGFGWKNKIVLRIWVQKSWPVSVILQQHRPSFVCGTAEEKGEQRSVCTIQKKKVQTIQIKYFTSGKTKPTSVVNNTASGSVWTW